MSLMFVLTMPNNNSWNGKWSGEDNFYADFRQVNKKTKLELDGKSFFYNFGDGWTAMVAVQKIDSKEKRKLERKSKGFYGYNWMVDSILSHGKIIVE